VAGPPSHSTITDLPAVKDIPVSQRTTILLTNADSETFAVSRDSAVHVEFVGTFSTGQLIQVAALLDAASRCRTVSAA